MTDNSDTGFPKQSGWRWRERLYDGRWILLMAALALFYFLLSGGISPWQALGAFAVILAATLVVPRDLERGESNAGALTLSLQHSQQAAMTFADALIEPCFLLDGRALVVHRNPAAAAQFPATSVGNPIAFSLRNPALLSAIERVRNTGGTETVEVHQTIPNETWFNVSIAPLNLSHDPRDGQQARWIVVTMHNLTEQKRVEAMRADFVANASHELRTPLTSLIGFIETLQGPAAKDAAAREKFLGIMRNQAERMSNLIDDLLSLSRIELRQHVRPTSEVDLALILSEVAEGLQTQAKEAGVKVNVEVPGEQVRVKGEREELYEVFENLIDNAIKYGASGKSVEVALKPVSRAGADYMVSVTDHGAGLAEELVPRLTERFYRVDAESSRKKKGTGLGLAIVKHIVARHGGQMTIRSRPGEGMSVEILLSR